MNKKSIEEKAKIIQLLVEGNSMRSASRIAECSINTVSKLLVDVGKACAEYQDKHLRNLPCTRIECDEMWSYCYARRQNVPEGLDKYAGDLWTFTSICPDTKIVPCWLVGTRDSISTKVFMEDLASRMKNRIQLTTDGFRPYVDAVEEAFHNEIDFAMLNKQYTEPKGKQFGKYNGAIKERQIGAPDVSKISTSIVERNNLTMRMNCKRLTRKTNAHSKKAENHSHAVALHFFYYNFCRIHKTIRITPAMAAGVTDRLWSIEDMVNL